MRHTRVPVVTGVVAGLGVSFVLSMTVSSVPLSKNMIYYLVAGGRLGGAAGFVQEATLYMTDKNASPLTTSAAWAGAATLQANYFLKYPLPTASLYGALLGCVALGGCFFSDRLALRSRWKHMELWDLQGVSPDILLPKDRYIYNLFLAAQTEQREFHADGRYTLFDGSTVHVDDYRDEHGIVNYGLYYEAMWQSYWNWADSDNLVKRHDTAEQQHGEKLEYRARNYVRHLDSYVEKYRSTDA
eukprot:TRINITY_DN14884_c0_g2_i1.p1 TRINITY_DN14884_c0_g2~~TRINITY_DN14884_c0_g2_i1.p1  ORF type:complete len:282 (+),score=28.99 TRINITY_DN14884_c0_g2_i1:118-846(+)